MPNEYRNNLCYEVNLCNYVSRYADAQRDDLKGNRNHKNAVENCEYIRGIVAGRNVRRCFTKL